MSGTATAVHKAVRPDLLAPKRKHVRSMLINFFNLLFIFLEYTSIIYLSYLPFNLSIEIIVDSWNTNASMYKMLEKEGVTKNGCTCFKALTVIHKTLQEGPPRVSRIVKMFLYSIFLMIHDF